MKSSLRLLRNGKFETKSHYSLYEQRVMAFLEEWQSSRRLRVSTSGSTGTPKIIDLNERQILASIQQTRTFFNLSDKTIFFCCLSIDYIAGKLMLLRAYELGAEAWIVEPSSRPFENLPLSDFEVKAGQLFMAFVPMQWQELLANPANHAYIKTASSILIGGAAVSSIIEETTLSAIPGLNVWSTYGMTETVTHVAVRKLGTRHFIPLPGIQLRTDARGCLEIKGPTTDDNWLTTNDLVNISGKGFTLLGRADNTINSGGVKIQLENVEQQSADLIEKNFPAARYFYYGLPDEILGTQLVLFIETNRELPPNFAADLKDLLPPYSSPRNIFLKERFYELGSGKIDKLKTVHEHIHY